MLRGLMRIGLQLRLLVRSRVESESRLLVLTALRCRTVLQRLEQLLLVLPLILLINRK